MTIEIPFDAAIYKAQNKLLFDSTLVKIRRNIRKLLIFSLCNILMGGLIILGKSSTGEIFIMMGLILLVLLYFSNVNYKDKRKKFFETIDVLAAESLENNQITFVEFQDEHFRIQDFKMDCTLQWISFSGYKKIEDTLFLYTNLGMAFMFSASQIGSDKFIEIVSFLERKNVKEKE
jgi:hypothetical protein